MKLAGADKFLESVKRIREDRERIYSEMQEKWPKREEKVQRILKSRMPFMGDAKVMARLLALSHYTSLAAMSNEVLNSFIFEIVGLNLKSLELTVDIIRKQLYDSKILEKAVVEKAKTIEDIEEIKKAVQSVYGKMKKAMEDRQKDLSFIE